ncbi:DUF1851 domain-containing protein [Tessaracoccus terricola]
MPTFIEFTPVAPISEETIARFAPQVPDKVVAAWREHGAGFVGSDGYVRFVDPARAAQMLEGVFGLPKGATVLFASALGDLIVHAKGLYLVIKARWGAIDIVADHAFEQLVQRLEDPAVRATAREWEPYPDARKRMGVPGFEECFGFVPLLALGGRSSADNLQPGGLYEHLAVIASMAGMPQTRRILTFEPTT